jgi:O-antigen ligase
MKSFIHKSIYPILLFAGFSISLPPLFKTLSLFLLLLVLVLNLFVNKNQTYFSNILNFKNPVLYLIGFYLLYCIGMFYSTDLKEGFRDLIIKLPLILLPIAVCLLPKRIITKKRLWRLFFAFALGLVVMQVYLLIMALSNAFSVEGFKVYKILYVNLAQKYHPTYLSLFTSFAFLFSYLVPLNYILKSKKKALVIKTLVMTFFSVYNVLLSSRIGIIAMALGIVVVLFNELIFRKCLINTMIYFIVGVIYVASFLLIGSYDVRYVDIVNKTKIQNEKIKRSQGLIVENFSDIVQNTAKFDSQRSVVLKNIDDIILRAKFFGVGTGDVVNEMQDFYSDHDFNVKRYYNPHNQFIQIAVSIGVVGLIFFILMLLLFSLPFWNKEGLIFLFSIGMLCVYMMTESIIERQQGVHFVAFFLIWLSGFKTIKKEV